LPLLVLALFTTGCLKKELVTGLSERESQEIIVLLKERGLDAKRELVAREREAPTWTVFVRGGDQNLVTSWRVLQESGLPREPVQGLDNVFAGQGMIPTETEERAKVLVGLSGEMSRTLRSVKGVVDARVHFVLPEDNPLLKPEEKPRPSAAVLIKYAGDKPALSEQEVLRLVSKGVEGLQEQDIAVVFHKVEQTPVEPADLTWYLGNEELLVAALCLMGGLALLSLVLMGRLRSQTNQVKKLQQMLYSASQQTTSVTSGRS
jgi:type III secretion protein J